MGENLDAVMKHSRISPWILSIALIVQITIIGAVEESPQILVVVDKPWFFSHEHFFTDIWPLL